MSRSERRGGLGRVAAGGGVAFGMRNKRVMIFAKDIPRHYSKSCIQYLIYFRPDDHDIANQGGVVGEFLTPHPPPEDEAAAVRGMPKTADYLHAFRGMWDTAPDAICWVRVFAEAGQTPVVVMSEHPHNPSTSVTKMAELLAAELIRAHFPRRFDHNPPAILLEHYPAEYTGEGRVSRKPTWDRLTFHSWAPRRVWLGGQERLAFGEPEWRSLPAHEVAALIGEDELHAPPPPLPPDGAPA